MAHQDEYIEDQNNCFDVLDWFDYYANLSTPVVPLRYAYLELTKTQLTKYDNGEDRWQKTQVWHWSYFWVIDWQYPASNKWTRDWHREYDGKKSVSGSTGGRIEYDSSSVLRERLQTLSTNIDTIKVDLDIPRVYYNDDTQTTFFAANAIEPYTYVYSASELDPERYEIYKEDKYSFSVTTEAQMGDEWELDSSGNLFLLGIHDEVLPDTDSPPPTKWLLDENNNLTMPILKEVDNDLGAFANAESLKTIILPDSVETLGKLTYRDTLLSSVELPTNCQYHEKTFPENCSVSGGVLIPTPKPLRRNYIYTVNEITGDPAEEIITSIKCNIGDLVVAAFVIRGSSFTISDGWTLLGESMAFSDESISQGTAMAYKYATNTTETFTVRQPDGNRIYVNLVAIDGAQIGTFSGFTNQETGKTITLDKPEGLVLWAVSSYYWSTSSPYPLWTVDNGNNNSLIQLPESTQPRCLIALDRSNSSSVTFTAGGSGNRLISGASLTLTGITDFVYT